MRRNTDTAYLCTNKCLVLESQNLQAKTTQNETPFGNELASKVKQFSAQLTEQLKTPNRRIYQI
jgi:hypothetical protein